MITAGAQLISCNTRSMVNSVNNVTKNSNPTIITINKIMIHKGNSTMPKSSILVIFPSMAANAKSNPASAPKAITAITAANGVSFNGSASIDVPAKKITNIVNQ